MVGEITDRTDNGEYQYEIPGIAEALIEDRIALSDQYIEKLEQEGAQENLEVYRKTIELAEKIKEAGGRLLLIGGPVRDELAGKLSKDYDVEVYGLEQDKLKEVASQIGKIKDVGESFEVLKVSFAKPGFEDLDIDIALPRREAKVAEGHKGFETEPDPFMSIQEATKRRDFTINAMAADPLTGEVFDCHGGKEDLDNKTLKVTDAKRFGEDPLRVLRALQFVGRFDLTIDLPSKKVLLDMIDRLNELPKERFAKEWRKLLLKSEQPSKGLRAGMETGVFIETNPKLVELEATLQDPKWHPEGNAWEHTLQVVDEAARRVREAGLSDDEAYPIMLAAICHDLGKPDTTIEKHGKYKAKGHEAAGEEPTKNFLLEIGADKIETKNKSTMYEKVLKLVTSHMRPLQLFQAEQNGDHVGDGAIRRLAREIHPATIQELVVLCEADRHGRRGPNQQESQSDLGPGPWLIQRAREAGVDQKKQEPIIQDRAWLSLGYKPGKIIGRLNRAADRLHEELDYSKEQIMKVVADVKDAETALEKLNSLLPSPNEESEKEKKA